LYAGPISARNILTNLIPNLARPEKPGLTYNSAAVNLNFPNQKDLSRTEQSYVGRTAVKVKYDWHQARTQEGGCRGCIPPTRPKQVLTWHLISLKIIAKTIFVLYIA